MRELRSVTPSAARDTLERLVNGYTDKSGAGYPAALTNAKGCVLAQKGANRKTLTIIPQDNGYIQITPISTRTRAGTANGSVATKALPQGAHRLVVIAHGSDDDRHHLLHDSWHASHRCHEPTCISPDHIACESKDDNEKRKDCARELWVLKTRVGGEEVVVRSKYKCQCEPACIPKVLEAEEEELEA
ncbi:hypothetical protein diail_5750 [Diaporthe ilicicola]|nr:hypothetical protein diail_5750 [Diaporthe ilicicola]